MVVGPTGDRFLCLGAFSGPGTATDITDEFWLHSATGHKTKSTTLMWGDFSTLDVQFNGVITSTVTTGTAPFTVASTTEVTNLKSATATLATTATTATTATAVGTTLASTATHKIMGATSGVFYLDDGGVDPTYDYGSKNTYRRCSSRVNLRNWR